MPERLTVIRIQGDSDAIIDGIKSAEPTMSRVGKENGAIFHCAARTDDGAIIVNLWDSPEGSDNAFQNPEVQQALAEAMGASGVSGPPERNHYEVAEYRIV